MAKPRMDLSAFVGKLLEEQDEDVLREGIRVLSQALMETEVAGLIGDSTLWYVPNGTEFAFGCSGARRSVRCPLLVSAMDINNSPDFAGIADVWISYYRWAAARPRDDSGRQRTLSEFREEDAEAAAHGFWASEAVDRLVRTEPEKAWWMILRLVELSPDDYMLATVAAGPLENLLGLQPYAFIHRVEDQARTDPKFRRCLSGVWGWSSIPDDVQVRMRRTWEGEDPL